MNVAEVAAVVACTLALVAVMVAIMARINRSERELMERRHAEWVADGSVPEEKPNFYSGPGGSSG